MERLEMLKLRLSDLESRSKIPGFNGRKYNKKEIDKYIKDTLAEIKKLDK